MGNQLNTPAITVVSGIELVGEINAIGLAGDGEVGNEALIGNPPINAGAAGAGAVGAEDVNVMGWGNMGWGEDTWGDGR